METWTIADGTLALLEGDITAQHTDAIVNAANAALAGGGGVDGAIHRAAGMTQLRAACQTIINDIGQLEAGKAVITPGFALPAKYIIHTVGPIWRGGSHNEAALLAQAYRHCLELASQHGLSSISFPAISCGAYGFPLTLAMPIALEQLIQGLRQGLIAEARLVLHGQESYAAWLDAVATIFQHPTEEH